MQHKPYDSSVSSDRKRATSMALLWAQVSSAIWRSASLMSSVCSSVHSGRSSSSNTNLVFELPVRACKEAVRSTSDLLAFWIFSSRICPIIQLLLRNDGGSHIVNARLSSRDPSIKTLINSCTRDSSKESRCCTLVIAQPGPQLQ